MSFQPPKGTDDLMAPASESWREVFAAWDRWTARYGYPLAMTPVFEATDLFERGVGDSTEVVTKQMYTFTDRGGRSVTLRPENTAGIVRAYLNSGIQGAWKGAYSGPNFRYERPQAGRRRQFWQLGVEYLAVQSPYADSEVIDLGFRFLTDVGVKGLELLLNSLGDPACRPAYTKALRSYLEAKKTQLSQGSVELIDRNPLRVLDSKADQDVLEDPPRMVDYLCEACATHYEQVKHSLEDLDIPFRRDDSLVRGLDYYTRTTFEYISTGLDAAQNAVGGGGRYDGLAEAIGGPPTPGVGFALGLDRIILSIDEPVRSHLDAYLVSEKGPEPALRAVSSLRADGIAVDFDTEGRSVKAQFRAARRQEAPVVLVLKDGGEPIDIQKEDERHQLPLEEVAQWLKDQK